MTERNALIDLMGYAPHQIPNGDLMAERGNVLPIGRDIYGGSHWAAPNLLLSPWNAFWDAGNAASQGDWRGAGYAGGEAAGSAITGSMALARPAGSIGMSGTPRVKANINGLVRSFTLTPREVDGLIRPRFHLDPDGTPVWMIPPRQEWQRNLPIYDPGPRLFRYMDEFFQPNDDLFFRTSRNPRDFDYLASGKHRGSINHNTGEYEGGLSVARIPEYADGYKYGYTVRGNVIRYGSDGEPILDLATARPSSDRMKIDDLQLIERERRQQRLNEIGLTYDDYVTLRTGNHRMLKP